MTTWALEPVDGEFCSDFTALMVFPRFISPDYWQSAAHWTPVFVVFAFEPHDYSSVSSIGLQSYGVGLMSLIVQAYD